MLKNLCNSSPALIAGRVLKIFEGFLFYRCCSWPGKLPLKRGGRIYYIRHP